MCERREFQYLGAEQEARAPMVLRSDKGMLKTYEFTENTMWLWSLFTKEK